LINVDYKDEIERFSKGYSNSDFESIFSAIDQAILNVKANVYTPLILTDLGIKIYQHLRRIDR
jgi:hypothetical protein